MHETKSKDQKPKTKNQMLNRLINPNFPKAAIGIKRNSISAVSLQRKGWQGFTVNRAATVHLPDFLLNPSFSETNILDLDEMLVSLNEAASGAGLGRQRKWSVSLPADAARTAILTIEHNPGSNKELQEMLTWKTERTFGAPTSELRVAYDQLSPDTGGKPRFLAVAIKLSVLEEYEGVFEALGWQVGLILPRHISEAQWLLNSSKANKNHDALLISSQNEGFTAILIRQSQPTVVRSVTCEDTEREDELYRLLLFYRDRLAAENIGDFSLEKFLVIGGGFSFNRLQSIIQETLGRTLPILKAEDVGLTLPSSEFSFDELAAPAGLAKLAWS
jgi:hypothetical protein